MRIVVICTLSTGLPAISRALRQGVPIAKLIGLNPDAVRDRDRVSGFVDIADFAQSQGLNFAYAQDYSLRSDDLSLLGPAPDLLWVTGWQRLLPPAFLNAARWGALGVHGSCDGIRLGRGRSPQNWALIMGKTSFELSLFRITPGIDDGAVVASRRFALSASDTIRQSYAKVAEASADMLAQVVSDAGMIDRARPQVGPFAYFPKRTADDGLIDWRQDFRDVANLVRALAHPYPQARCLVAGRMVRIESATPRDIGQQGEPGEVLEALESGAVLVQAAGGGLQIDALARGCGLPSVTLQPGQRLVSSDARAQVTTILERFGREFPGKRLNPSLRGFWQSRGHL